MPIGPLMIEHRLIERMIRMLASEAQRLAQSTEVDPLFVDAAVDFIRTYADRTHHGKEEEIFFRELDAKALSDEDRAVMDELVAEHVIARQTTRALVEAKERYLASADRSPADVVACMEKLAGLYPAHITKEDKVFFPAAMRYFTREEQDAMLEEMWAFDRAMIHEKYRAVVERFEGRP